jgi:ABC-type sugar transport system substrate-binding protein
MEVGMTGFTRRLCAVLTVAAASVGLIACGSNDSGDSGSSSAKAEATVKVSPETAAAFKQLTGLDVATKPLTEAELTSRVAKYTAKPTTLLQTKPVSKKAEPGKQIVYLVCGVPICSEVAKNYEAAANTLGWTTKKVDLGVSPQQFNQAFTRAAELKPDLVVGSGLNRDLISKGLATLAAANIPTIQWAAGITPKTGEKVYTMTDVPQHNAAGIQAAEYLAKDGGMKTHAVIYNVPQYAITTAVGKTVESYLPAVCPGCTADYKEIAVTDIGKLGQKVTAYVQQHPETTHVLCTNGDFCLGVAQALKAAGQSKVKVVTDETATTNLQNIKNGTEHAGIALPLAALGWQLVDQSQRIFNGDDLSQTTLVPSQMITEVTDPSDPTVGAPADFEAQYKKLWNP